MKRLMLFVLMLIAISGCSEFDFFPSMTTNQRITSDTFDGVIFTAEKSAEAGLQYEFNDPIVEYWTPTEEDVQALEAGLLPFLEESLASDENRTSFWEHLADYRRQYFGIAFEEGERLIYANYFCYDDFDHWLDSYVTVEDGGECFFQVMYNPVTNVFSNLRINGYA